MNKTVSAIRRKKNASASNDSEQLLAATLNIIDALSREHRETEFLQKALRILCQSKTCLWRRHWLILRRHILDKIKEKSSYKT